MNILSDGQVRIERVWCGEAIGAKLIAHHLPTGISVERVIGFEVRSGYGAELQAELLLQLSRSYPPEDFVIERGWTGPGKGASLCLRHIPSGKKVERHVGYEPVTQHCREMVVELFQQLHKK